MRFILSHISIRYRWHLEGRSLKLSVNEFWLSAGGSCVWVMIERPHLEPLLSRSGVAWQFEICRNPFAFCGIDDFINSWRFHIHSLKKTVATAQSEMCLKYGHLTWSGYLIWNVCVKNFQERCGKYVWTGTPPCAFVLPVFMRSRRGDQNAPSPRRGLQTVPIAAWRNKLVRKRASSYETGRYGLRPDVWSTDCWPVFLVGGTDISVCVWRMPV